MSREFLWYIPNTVLSGHRGDDTVDGWGSLEYSVELAQRAERNGWGGALIGAGWGRADSFTIATAIAARTTTFAPLVAIRPGYWHPAHFASAATTLDQLSQGRLLVNVVTGADDVLAYGDVDLDKSSRYDRTREFLQVVRRLWTEEDVTFDGDYFSVEHSTLQPRPYGADDGRHPKLYFGARRPPRKKSLPKRLTCNCFGASHSTGSPSGSNGSRRCRRNSAANIRRWSTGCASRRWSATLPRRRGADAEAKVAELAGKPSVLLLHNANSAEGQRRLSDLAGRGEVLDSCLYTTPSKYGGEGAGTTWLVGSADEVAAALQKYGDLGVKHFVLSDTPYLSEVSRIGEQVLPLLRNAVS